MKTKLKPILLVCAVAFAVVAVGPVTSAFAETGQWYINGEKFSGEESLNIASTGPLTFKTTINGTKLVVQCELKGSSPKIYGNNLNTWGFVLSGCKAEEPTGCSAGANQLASLSASLGGRVEGGLYDNLTTSATEQLAKIAITGCALEGGYKVTGVSRCKIIGPEDESVVKECELTATSSQLKFGKNPATLTGVIDMELAGMHKGKVWTAKMPPYSPPPLGEWSINGSKLSGEESLKIASSGPATLTTSINGTRLVVQCESLTGGESPEGAIKISGNNKNSGPLLFSGCKYVEPSGCDMPSTVTTNSLSGSLGTEAGSVYDQMGTGTEQIIVKFATTGCSLEGDYEYTGSPRCKIAEPEIEGFVKQCEFTATSSKLKWGVNPMTLTGTVEMELAGANKGEPWTA